VPTSDLPIDQNVTHDRPKLYTLTEIKKKIITTACTYGTAQAISIGFFCLVTKTF
jgi:hypothetical protein